MDLTKEKKLLADQWSLAGANGMFLIGFTSGKENFAFAVFPPGAKAFLAQLNRMVEQYEIENGTIDDSSSTVSHLSPMQPKK